MLAVPSVGEEDAILSRRINGSRFARERTVAIGEFVLLWLALETLGLRGWLGNVTLRGGRIDERLVAMGSVWSSLWLVGKGSPGTMFSLKM